MIQIMQQQLGELAEPQNTKVTQAKNVINMLDLEDTQALVNILTELRVTIKPDADEERDEAVLKAISKKTGYTITQVMDAFFPILEAEMGIQKVEALYRLMDSINEAKLQMLVSNFNRMQSDRPDMPPVAILNSIEMAERQDYWREDELQRTYEFALRRGKIVVGES